MKTITLTLCSIFCSCAVFANSLLQSPVTGQPFSSGMVNDIELVSNGTDVALIIAVNATGKVYAININDNNPADSASNVVSTQVPAFTTLVMAALGSTNATVLNMEVNPISKSIYALVYNQNTGTNVIVKVTGNGTTITPYSLTNVEYSAITFTAGTFTIQDMSWGNNTLFVSVANSSLNGEVGTIIAPFVHNGTTTNRATTMHKSNWGGGYYTSAPLEKMGWANVAGNDRIMGVTTCAPGYSVETANIAGSGVLQVTEDFDMNSMPSLKVVPVKQNGTNFLLDLHQGFSTAHPLYRIGEKYLDGSQVTAGEFNNNSEQLRDFAGNPSVGLTTDEIMQYTGTFKRIAFFTDYDLLVLDDLDNLKLFTIGTLATGIEDVAAPSLFSLFPNPASGSVVITNNSGSLQEGSSLVINSIDGKEVLRTVLRPVTEQKVDISMLVPGNYLVSVISGENKIATQKLVVK